MTINKFLTIRYLVALSLIFAVLCFTLVTFLYQISTAKNDSYLINISGMQRMLSQRIGLISREIALAESSDDIVIYLNKLEGATSKMRSNHEQLTSGNFDNGLQQTPSPDALDFYFGKQQLNTRVLDLLGYADNLSIEIKTNGKDSKRANDLILGIVKIARNGLLSELNEMVQLYESEAKERIYNFEKIEIFAFVLGLTLLLAEIIFIFRPMVTSIASMTRDLKARNQELMEFSYKISHDVRAPIKSILGLMNIAELALSKQNEAQAKKAIIHTKENVHQLEKFTDDIIELTKMKMTDVPKEPTDIRCVLLACKKRHQVDDIDIQLQFANEFTEILMCKLSYLTQTLDNLVSNAVKYSDNSKQQSVIVLNADLQNEQVIISVKDNGLGIPVEYQDKMFQMFQRFHPKASYGSGLGLYLVALNAKALAGSIKFNPLPDGSEFTLTFPVQKEER